MNVKAPLAVAVAVGVAFVGQTLFQREGPAFDGVLLFAVASLCLLGISPRGDTGEQQTVPERRLGRVHLLLIGLGLLFICVCLVDLYLHIASNRALVAWLVGLALFVAGFWLGFTRLRWRLDRRELLILLLILLLALFMRSFRLEEMPPGVYLDEADNGVWSLRFLEMPYSPFTEHRHGNGTMPFQLLGLSLRIFGISPVVLRVFDVVVGLLTVLVFYFLAREMFGVRAAQIGTTFLAFSRWHVHFSRVAFLDNLQVPLFEALVVLFLWRGLRGGRRLDYVFAGLSFGLGFHTYLGYRVFPLVVGLYLLHVVFCRRGSLRTQLPGLLVFAAATFMTLSPLALYAVQRPDVFVRRAEAASVLLDVEKEGSYQPLVENIRKSLLMYNQRGDPRARHNLPDEPMLDGLSAIFFGLGLGYSVLRWRNDRYFLLLAWLFVGLLPGILSLADSNPHSLRTLGNVPPVFLLVAAFWDRAWATYAPLLQGKTRRYLVGAVAVLLAASLWVNFHTYFGLQASNKSVYYDFDPAQTEAGEYVQAHGAEELAIVSHDLANHSDLKFFPYEVPFTILDLNAHLPLRQQVQRDVVYVLDWGHASVVSELQKLYPSGEYLEHVDRYGSTMFYTYAVSREEAAAVQGLRAAYYEGLDFEEHAVVERIDKTVDFSWSEPAVELPFSARWQGSLYVPKYGSYTLVLEASGSAVLRVGEDLEIEVENDRGEVSEMLPAGFHALEVEVAQEESGHLRLSWVRPDGEEEIIPSSDLYIGELYGHGLLGLYRQGTAWEGEPEVIQLDPFIGPNDVLPSPFCIEWLGKIYAPVGGSYLFGTTSDDGSYLYVDGVLLVDNGGHHGDVYQEGQIQLEEGFHDVRLLYFQEGGGRKIELYWTPPGGAKAQVPQEQLFPEGAELRVPPPLPASEPVVVPTPPPAAMGTRVVTFVNAWGDPGDGPGELDEPRGVAASLDGRVYVADTGNARIQVFDGEGRFLDQWGDEVLGEPFDLTVSQDGRVYVVDTEYDSLFVFSADGQLEGRWGERWGLFDPRGVAVDWEGHVYVANTGDNVVLEVSPEGQVLGRYGAFGYGAGDLNQPSDVAVDEEGHLYVVDVENRRVQVLDRTGSYVREWPISAANTVDSPHIVWGKDGLLYLTDPEMATVVVYDEYGRLVTSWGERGSLDGQSSKPIGIGFDQRSSIYIADTYNHRIEKLSVVP
jgi:4-amino-4-deoxy-L-arabinose transferase-like glycosyltransferase/sugar lactone lactonase YvrE